MEARPPITFDYRRLERTGRLVQSGVRVVCVTQQLDFNGTVGKMLAAIFFALGEMEQQTRRERQAVGIAQPRRGQVQGPATRHNQG